MGDYSPTKPPRARPVSFAFPSSSSSSSSNLFTQRPTSPPSPSTSTSNSYRTSSRSSHRTTASLSSLAQLNLGSGNGSHVPLSPSTTYSGLGLERSPSFASGHWGTFTHASSGSGPGGGGNGVGREFEDVQNRTFAKWLNARLEPNGFPPVHDLGVDFSDGTRLIQLIEVLTEVSLGRYNQNPVLRVQKMENTKKALDRIKEMGVHLTNIGPEDIVDGNRKLILGMIWSLVLRFSIADINEEGSHAKEGLLLWCQRKTAPYEEVDVRDFTRSWMDGLAFCALIHRHRPDLLDYSSLPKDASQASSAKNLETAFKIAEQHLGIPQLLDVEDVCGTRRPDERSIMTYVAQFFHAFSSKAQQENESKVISNFVENMEELMLAVHDYERRATALLSALSAHLLTLSALPSPSTTPYPTLLSLLHSFSHPYLTTTRRAWAQERFEVVALLRRVQEKLRTYGLRGYEPGEGVRPRDLDEKWIDLELAEKRQINSVTRAIQRIQTIARQRVIALAEPAARELNSIERELGSITGPLDLQLEQTRQIASQLDSFDTRISLLSEAESQCLACDVAVPIFLSPSSGIAVTVLAVDGEELDGGETTSVQTAAGLEWEVNMVREGIKKKIAFIETQIVARKQTNVKPEQLEEFESAFRAFDKDSRNKLGMDELVGALRSLGVAEINLDEFARDENDEVGFAEFIRFLTERAEDRLTGEKVRSCFRSVAAEKGFVTELDLTRLALPPNALSFLRGHMPQSTVVVQGEHGEEQEEVALDYEEFLNAFLE